MNYLLFGIITLYISNRGPLQLFLSGLGKKKYYEKNRDRDLLEMIRSKTGLQLSEIKIQNSEKPFGMMGELPGKPIMILSKNLFETFTPQELEYVVLHEAGHYKLHHTIRLTIIQLALLTIGCVLIALIKSSSVFVATSFGVLFGIIGVQVGRTMEYEADQFSLEKVSDPSGMISATEKFAHFWKGPKGLLRWLFYSGVPYEKRIENAKKELQRRKMGYNNRI